MSVFNSREIASHTIRQGAGRATFLQEYFPDCSRYIEPLFGHIAGIEECINGFDGHDLEYHEMCHGRALYPVLVPAGMSDYVLVRNPDTDNEAELPRWIAGLCVTIFLIDRMLGIHNSLGINNESYASYLGMKDKMMSAAMAVSVLYQCEDELFWFTGW